MYDKVLKLFEFEKENDLLNFKVDNIYVWQYLRGEIVYEILNKNSEDNIFFNNKIENKYIKTILKTVNLIKNSICFNPFITFRKYDRIVFSHSRKSFINDKYIDIYSEDFIDNKTLVIDSAFNEKYHTKYKRNSFINLMMFMLRFFLKVNNDVDKVKDIEYKFKQELKTTIDLQSLFNKHIKTFKAFYLLYNILFKCIKPKEIIIVVNYGQAPLIKAAKDNGIKVIEVQHGEIGKYHYGYSFPYNKNLEYFPDYLYVFGEYFRDLSYLPLPKDNIKICNFSYFNNTAKLYKNVMKIENVITIISEATIMEGKLQKFILNNIDFLKNYKVYYKLHPQEMVDNVYKFNKITQKIMELDFIEVVADQYNLYQLLFKSHYIISPSSSTVIYEALETSCKVIIPKIGYWDNIKEFSDIVLLVSPEEKLNNQFVENYFDNIKCSPKGHFIKSLNIV